MDAGDDLLKQLYHASYRRLVGQLYAVCGDLTEAEDAVQEAFARAVAQGRRFARLDRPEAWLRTVALNVARTRHRRRATAERLGLHRACPEPRHPVDLTDDRLALGAALRRLPTGQREVIALHYLADLPVSEVAQTLNVPVGTVKARLSRGRMALAALLAGSAHAASEEVRHA